MHHPESKAVIIRFQVQLWQCFPIRGVWNILPAIVNQNLHARRQPDVLFGKPGKNLPCGGKYLVFPVRHSILSDFAEPASSRFNLLKANPGYFGFFDRRFQILSHDRCAASTQEAK